MKNRSLTFKFTLMFAAFTLLTLIISSLLSYINQTKLYKTQREESIQYVASYLDDLLVTDGDEFIWYQKYFLEHYKELLVPHSFTAQDIPVSKARYETLFAKNHPGKVLGQTIAFEELAEEVKTAYAIYKHEYYLDKFEKSRQRFNLIYVEYIIPFPSAEEDSLDIMYALDAMRDERIVDEKKYIELGITVTHKREEHQKEFEAWLSGKRPKGYDSFDNEYGKTYAFYSPVIINGEKLGAIGVEVEIAKVHKGILYATIQQMLMIGVVLNLFMFFLLLLIRSKYIRKLMKIRDFIEEYSKTKKTEIAENLTLEITNKDEISSIIGKFTEMIYELDRYMKSLSRTAMDLQSTRQKAMELSELATKDSLTGIRNKTSYDKEVQKIEWEMSCGLTDIGVAMVDLNFLKRINDTYGHAKGNIAIVSVCKILCNIFNHSPVFRIGGDEFVVILKGEDLANVEDLTNKFKAKIKELQDNTELEYWERTSAAIGYAIFNKEIDCSYDNIFKRADKEMYTNKKAMKAVREE
ncbi:GGDEF domain-containing protein [uncultured Treponema sp.]|uniref:GGDEF domain-containing protein n=1 Tax=uncultured Treponema sp. TaxID=162155 RepID=UPI0025DCE86D|nr:GGDEF domain-containing protein [uncultured Treponema sp.]